ncbi:MAG TPA: deoxyribose-phosphate aldolase [Xanthomonadales bacterium]|nr:deoxyribose-phosphate aldolase [Xanthomonadales bacterium]
MATKPPSRRELAARLLPLLDLTSLGEDDTPDRIAVLCASARTPFGVPAAICVHPEHVTTVARAMHDTPVRVATVVNFPDGGDDEGRVVRETRRAIAAGAHEIDAVLPYGAFRAGRVDDARRVVDACRAACADGVVLKLILETGELSDPDAIRRASLLGIDAGVDFLKTSTGKASVNATPHAAAVMLDAIAESRTGCGFKAAGGIRTIDDAAMYVALAEARLGTAFVAPRRFRIGASALFVELRDALAAR